MTTIKLYLIHLSHTTMLYYFHSMYIVVLLSVYPYPDRINTYTQHCANLQNYFSQLQDNLPGIPMVANGKPAASWQAWQDITSYSNDYIFIYSNSYCLYFYIYMCVEHYLLEI